MKKTIIIMLICLCVCFLLLACSNTNVELSSNDNSTISSEIGDEKESTKETSQKDDGNSKYPNIEKLIFKYIDGNIDIDDTDEIDRYIDGIISCTAIPDVEMIYEIGEITIRYNDSKDDKILANLYVGEDQNIYAKYIDSTNDKYAFLIEV